MQFEEDIDKDQEDPNFIPLVEDEDEFLEDDLDLGIAVDDDIAADDDDEEEEELDVI